MCGAWSLRSNAEGMKGFRLYAPPEEDDPEEEVDAEMSAEECSTWSSPPPDGDPSPAHWLRLVEYSEDANRSRWPMHSTWEQLREAFGTLACVPPLEDKKRTLVRGARYRGTNAPAPTHGGGGHPLVGGRRRFTNQHCADDTAALDGADRGEGGGAHHRQMSTLPRARQAHPDMGARRDG